MKGFTRSILAAALALGLSSPVRAESEEQAEKNRRALQEEVSKMIDGYLLSHVQDALGLSDDKAAKVVPLIVKHQAKRRAYSERKSRLVSNMRKALESGSATEAQIGELMKDMHSLETEDSARLYKIVEAIDQELTVVQQAKFRVLEQEVHRRMGELREKARRRQREEEQRVREREQRDRRKGDEARPKP